MLGGSFYNLINFHMDIISIVSNPSFCIELLEFLENERVVSKFGVLFTVDAYSCDEFVVTLWNFFVTVDARKDVLINIYRKWHWFIQFKSFATLVFIKSLHFDNQNMWSIIQKLLRKKSIIEAIPASLCSSMNVEVLVQLIGSTSNSFAI